MKVDIEFHISGLCYQTLEIFESCWKTREEVIEGIIDGEITTSCDGTMAVIDHASGKPVYIGRVTHQKFEADYYDFSDNS